MRSAAPERLSLALLAHGASQQVYVRGEAPDEGWVYKTPAVIDALLPTPVTWRSMRPVSRWKRRLFELLVEMPAEYWNERAGRSVGRRIASRSATISNRLCGVWALARRRRQFDRMCAILQRIAEERLENVVLPFEIVDTECALHAEGMVTRYCGLVLKQRRADIFFEHFDGLECFDWTAPARVQHELWRHGIGLVDADEVLGPRNWAVLNGQVLLADTGSLTENLGEVRRVLSAKVLDDREREIPTWWPRNVSRSLPEYFAQVRRHVNQEWLDRLWRTAYGDREREVPRSID